MINNVIADDIFVRDGVWTFPVFKRKVKDCPGIAQQVRGQTVYVELHSKFKGSW